MPAERDWVEVVIVVPEVGIAPTSPPLQGGANLPQLLGEMACRAVAAGDGWPAKP